MKRVRVSDLVAAGALRVEDGNHGNDRPRPDEFVSLGVPFIRAADMTSGIVDFTGAGKINDVARSRIRKGVGAPGDLILSHKGTVGKVAVAPADSPDFVCSPQTTFWRSLDSGVVDQRYLRYVLASQDFVQQLDLLKGQTDMAPYVSLTGQRSMYLDLLEIGVQRSIGEVLGALDDKIAANTNLVETASAFAAALLSDRSPSVALAEVVAHQKKSIAPADFGNVCVAHFSLPAFDAGQRPQMTSPQEIKSSKFLIEKPCVLVSKLNPRFPRIWDVAELPMALAISSTEFLVLESERCASTVLWAILSQPSFSAELESKVAGTSGSHQRVRPDDLLATKVIDPRSLSQGMMTQIESLGRRIALGREESATLAQIRDALLPQLMSGTVRVQDAVQMVGDVST